VADAERFDAIVIGSGFGGAVAAARLAEAGLGVVVLERGAPHAPGSFPRSPRALREGFWDPSAGLYGMFDVWSFGRSKAVVASGLGGGSLIYSNVMLRKEERTFVRENLRDGGRESWPVTREELDPHYDRVAEVQAPQRYPVGHEPYASTPRARELARAAGELHLHHEHPPLAVTFAPAPGAPPVPGVPVAGGEDNVHGRPRLTCRLCGECNVGCNDGAKNTLDLTYLSRAWRAGARLRCLCEAQAIVPRDGGYEVRYVQHAAARDGHPEHLVDPSAGAEGRVHGRIVVLAAGTLGSTRLLLANRGALPGLSRALGRNYSSNGDMLMFVRNTRVPLDPSRGPAITTAVHVEGERSPSGREHWVQDSGAPAFTEWMWQMLEIPEDAWALRRTLWRRLRARLRGRPDTNLSQEISEALGSTRMSSAMMPMLGLGRDSPGGRLRLRGTALELTWDPDDSAAHFGALEQTARALAAQLGGDFVGKPWVDRSRTATVHPLGGCAMAYSPRDGVVDEWGEVHGRPGLFVADGAVMPGPVGANPSFTIAALADRFAERMIARAS
jgi:cholesterol oxidase